MLPRPLVIALILCAEAARALLRNKVRTALTALSITIGIAAVVWVVALGKAGAQRAEDQLQALGDNLVWIEAGSRNVAGVRTGSHGMTTLTAGDAQAILDEIPRVKSLSPQVDGTVLVIAGSRNWTTRYRGVSPAYLEIRRFPVATGSAFTSGDVEAAATVCLLGQTVREQLFGAADPVGQDVRIGLQLFQVVGVLAPKGQSASGQDQDDTILLPFTTVQKRLTAKGITWLDDIMCSATSPAAVNAAADDISDLLRQRHHLEGTGNDDFNIRRPAELLEAQREQSRTFALLLISIASVALVVGGIGIMNVMLASVAERTREIGLRLAIGASEWAVQLQFLAESVILSLFGGALGVAVSVGGSSALGQMLGWPVSIPLQAIALALGFSIGVGVFFGYYPARKASRLDPIAALRSE
jgi:putative ABC transport system permease protein